MSYAVIRDWYDVGLDGLGAAPSMAKGTFGSRTASSTAGGPKTLCKAPFVWDGQRCISVMSGKGLPPGQKPDEIGTSEEGSWTGGPGVVTGSGGGMEMGPGGSGGGGVVTGSGGGMEMGPGGQASGGSGINAGGMTGGGGQPSGGSGISVGTGAGTSGGRRSDGRTFSGGAAARAGSGGGFSRRSGGASPSMSSGGSGGGYAPPSPSYPGGGSSGGNGQSSGPWNRVRQMLAVPSPTMTPLSPDPGYGPWQTQHAYQAAQSAFAAQAAAAQHPGSNVTVITHVPPPAEPLVGPAAPVLANPSYVTTGQPSADSLLLQSAVVATEDKPFPWLLVLGVCAAGGGAYYLSTKKRRR